MRYRFSIVDKFDLLSLAYSSVFEVGDSNRISPYSRALAVQREHEIFYGQEGHFNYPFFFRPIPRTVISEKIMINRMNESPKIQVHSISVTGAAFSSVIHIGSTNIIEGESRVKHIRQLFDVTEEEVEESKAQQEAQQFSGS